MSATRHSIHALLIEDNPGEARLIREMLRDAGGDASLSLSTCDPLSSGLERLAIDNVDLVLLDLSLPDGSGLETFEAVHSAAPSVQVVVLSGLDDEGVAVRAVQQGAQDYLVKGRVDGGTITLNTLCN